jgi:hypothetical protein
MKRTRRLDEILEESREQIRAEEWLSHEDFWKQIDAEAAEPREPEKPRPKPRGRKPRKP